MIRHWRRGRVSPSRLRESRPQSVPRSAFQQHRNRPYGGIRNHHRQGREERVRHDHRDQYGRGAEQRPGPREADQRDHERQRCFEQRPSIHSQAVSRRAGQVVLVKRSPSAQSFHRCILVRWFGCLPRLGSDAIGAAARGRPTAMPLTRPRGSRCGGRVPRWQRLGQRERGPRHRDLTPHLATPNVLGRPACEARRHTNAAPGGSDADLAGVCCANGKARTASSASAGRALVCWGLVRHRSSLSLARCSLGHESNPLDERYRRKEPRQFSLTSRPHRTRSTVSTESGFESRGRRRVPYAIRAGTN